MNFEDCFNIAAYNANLPAYVIRYSRYVTVLRDCKLSLAVCADGICLLVVKMQILQRGHKVTKHGTVRYVC